MPDSSTPEAPSGPAVDVEAAAPTAAPAGSLPGIDTADLVKAVVEAAPTVTEAAPTTAPTTEPRFAALRDRNGNPFDPALHLANADGTPKLTPRGLLWGKPGVVLPSQPGKAAAAPTRSLDVAAAGARTAAGDVDPEEDEEDDEDGPEIHTETDPNAPEPVAPPAQITAEERRRLAEDTAEVTVQLLQALGKFVAGKEGAFKRDEDNGDEYRDLKRSYLAWYVTMENLVHISPGWIVAVNTGRYLSRCASTEVGERRIQKGTSWAGSAWSKVRLMYHTWRATSAAKR